MALISVVLFTLASFLYIYIHDIYLLLGIRFFQGIWFSIITTVTSAIAADLIPPARRGEGLGYFAMSMNLAVVIGPFIALNLLDKMSFSDLFILFSGIVTVAILCTALVRIPKGSDIRSAVFRLSFSNMFEKGAIRIATVGLFVSFCYSSVISFISVYAKSLGLIEASSYFFMVFAVTMMITRPFTENCMIKSAPESSFIRPLSFFAPGFSCLLSQTAAGCSCYPELSSAWATDLSRRAFRPWRFKLRRLTGAAMQRRLILRCLIPGSQSDPMFSGWLWHKPVFQTSIYSQAFLCSSICFCIHGAKNPHSQRKSGIYQWLNKPFNLAGPGLPGFFMPADTVRSVI